MAIRNEASDYLTFIGRILFSVIFITAGLHKIIDFNNAVLAINSTGLPFANFLAVLTIIFELGGGILILLGWYTRVGAIMILVFVLAVTFLIHHFWTYTGPALEIHLQSFMKNLTIMGGALYIFAFGPGAFSIDRMRRF